MTLLNILKWLGTGLIIAANVCRAFDMHTADMLATLVGAGLWAYAALRTQDYALLSVNIISMILMFIGLLQ